MPWETPLRVTREAVAELGLGPGFAYLHAGVSCFVREPELWVSGSAAEVAPVTWLLLTAAPGIGFGPRESAGMLLAASHRNSNSKWLTQ